MGGERALGESLWGEGGGGKYFFSGPKLPPSSRGHVPSIPSTVPSVPRTFCPLNVNFHINRPKRPGCPWDVPNLSPGRSQGIPTTKFFYLTFLYRFFVLHREGIPSRNLCENRSEIVAVHKFCWDT